MFLSFMLVGFCLFFFCKKHLSLLNFCSIKENAKKNPKIFFLSLILSLFLDFLVWKYTAAIYFMGVVSISLFTWHNIRF